MEGAGGAVADAGHRTRDRLDEEPRAQLRGRPRTDRSTIGDEATSRNFRNTTATAADLTHGDELRLVSFGPDLLERVQEELGRLGAADRPLASKRKNGTPVMPWRPSGLCLVGVHVLGEFTRPAKLNDTVAVQPEFGTDAH